MRPESLGNAPSDLAPPNKVNGLGMAIDQESALLDLPLEVFQTITWHMDVGTFFTSLLTCKHFLAAGQSRRNIFKHLNKLPGLRLGLDDLTTPDLLLLFRKRAAESGCAAVLADITRYRPAPRTTVSNAVFSPANLSQPGSLAQLATIHGDGILRIYDLAKHHVRLKAELHIRPEDENDSRIQILKISFSPSSRDLAALYRHRASSGSSLVSPFIDNFSPFTPRHQIYKLVTFHRLHAETKNFFYSSHQQESRVIAISEDEEPVGLALASSGNACIAWRNPNRRERTLVWLIGRDEKQMDACSYG